MFVCEWQNSVVCCSSTLTCLVQTNMNGAEQTRMVCIDLKRQAMLNFDSKMKLRKTLPLTHLVQVSRS